MSKKQLLFNIISIILFLSFALFYGYRAINYSLHEKTKKTLTTNLSERIIEEEESFYLVNEIEIKDNTYYFMKTTTNNYVYYKDMLWRIIKVNEDKTTTIILNDYVTILPQETTNKWLNKTKGEYNSGIYCKLLGVDSIQLLSEDDYNNTGGKNSFINNNDDFWIENNKYIDNEGNILESDNEVHKVRPVITLPAGTTIYAGTGGVDKPFVIEKHDNKYFVRDLKTNKYVLYNNMLWRVIEVHNDKVKLICEENLRNSDDEIIETNFSDYNNTINSKRKNLIYYLNYTYLNKIENSNYLTEGPFYIGKYKNDDYSTIFSDVKYLKVGLPTIADPYIYTDLDTFLLTSNYSNNKNIYSIDNGKLYQTLISETSNIRPVIYMKGNVIIKTGVGSLEKPYILGGLKDEETE